MNYQPIFNKLTRESLYKFIKANELKVKKSGSKEEIEKNLVDHFEKNTTDKEKFDKYYIDTESAGRKHFYLYRFKFSDGLIQDITKKCNMYHLENDRTFNPLKDDNKIYYVNENNCITIKKIQIKKVYTLLDEGENDDKLIKEYQITHIHFVEFLYFDFNHNRIICGYDTYGDILEKRNLDKSLFEFLEDFIPSYEGSLEQLITSDSLEKLRYLPNCLVFSIHNQANRYDSAVFKKERADVEDILRDLKQGKYKISEIKENNPDFDVQTNMLFEAGQSVAIDSDIDLFNKKIDFYYFTERGGIVSTFRLRMDSIKSQIITFSESVTKQELWDVFNRIN
ncbi:hypothetical protein EXM22_02040 [Oceanispirochaeta crateris]|uniref:Uncharacterized protein n=1 Tax=Oceanispirochaeta crateris TaxID=2518645 RepID=A0A5C1QII0_9SPIO|nr:hypothetical protein [Oceanispirochaeta crateris]QEN06830.1 hypothetical protein EXM22_02040 [Oceanispirochaeta crateris]